MNLIRASLIAIFVLFHTPRAVLSGTGGYESRHWIEGPHWTFLGHALSTAPKVPQGGYSPHHKGRIVDTIRWNTNFWYEELQKTLSKEDVYYVVYRGDNADLAEQLSSKQPAAFGDYVKQFAFMKEPYQTYKTAKSKQKVAGAHVDALLSDETLYDALKYLVFAKYCEAFTTPIQWGWHAHADFIDRDTHAVDSLVTIGKKLYAETSHEALQLRIGYQLTRMMNLTKKDEKATTYYLEYVSKIPAMNAIKYMAQEHYLGALYRLDKVAAYKKHVAMLSTHGSFAQKNLLGMPKQLSKDEWQALMDSTQSKQERAGYHIFEALRSKVASLEALKAICVLEPKSSRTDYVLFKYMQQLEKAYLHGDLFFDQERKDPSQLPLKLAQIIRERPAPKTILEAETILLKDTLQFLTDAIDRGDYHDKNLWVLSKGYTYFLDGQYEEASRALQDMSQETFTPATKSQRDLMQCLIDIAKPQALSDRAKKRFIALQTEPFVTKPHGDMRHKNYTIIKGLALLSAQKQLLYGQFAEALALYTMAGCRFTSEALLLRHVRMDELDDCIAFLTQENPVNDAWHAALRPHFKHALKDIYGLKQRALLVVGMYADVLKISPSYQVKEYAYIADYCHRAQADPSLAQWEKDLRYAKAFYVYFAAAFKPQQSPSFTPYFGEYVDRWVPISLNFLRYHPYRMERENTLPNVTYLDLAYRFFQKALPHITDREVKAQVLLCMHHALSRHYRRIHHLKDANATHLIEISRHYSDTEVHERLHSSCSFYRYLNQKR